MSFPYMFARDIQGILCVHNHNRTFHKTSYKIKSDYNVHVQFQFEGKTAMT